MNWRNLAKNKEALFSILGILVFLTMVTVYASKDKIPTHVYCDPANNLCLSFPAYIRTSYISHIDWPPTVRELPGTYTCNAGGKEESRSGKTAEKVMGGRTYCIKVIADNVSETIYKQFTYTWASANAGKIMTLNFSLEFPSCDKYDSPRKQACDTERSSFDLDGVIDGVARSIYQS